MVLVPSVSAESGGASLERMSDARVNAQHTAKSLRLFHRSEPPVIA